MDKETKQAFRTIYKALLIEATHEYTNPDNEIQILRILRALIDLESDYDNLELE